MGTLRLLLAVAVVIYHAGPLFGLRLVEGWVSVQMFFVISGFYMALVLTEKYTPERLPRSRSRFYLSRLLRLYPGFVAVTVGTLGLIAVTRLTAGEWPDPKMGEAWERLGPWAVPVLASNVTLVGQDVVQWWDVTADGRWRWLQWTGAAGPDGAVGLEHAMFVPQAWSVGCELWFYLLAPWLVRRRTWVLVGLAVVSLGIQLGLKRAGYQPGVFAPAQVCFFVAGMLGYRLGKRWAWWSHPAVGWAAFGLIVAGVVAAPWCESGVYHAGLYAGLAVGSYPLFKLTASWKWDRRVGELSYPVYLVHLAVLWAVKWTAARWGLEWSSGVVLAISLGLAVVLYLLVDRPCDLFRRRFAERPTDSTTRIA